MAATHPVKHQGSGKDRPRGYQMLSGDLSFQAVLEFTHLVRVAEFESREDFLEAID